MGINPFYVFSSSASSSFLLTTASSSWRGAMRHLRLHFHLHPLSTLLLLSSDPHRAATFTSYSRGGEIPLIPPMASLPGFAFSFIPLPPSLSLAHELKREESATVAECKKGEESGGGGPKTSLSLSLLSASPPLSLSLSLSLHSLFFRSSCLQRTKHRLSLPPPSATPLLPPRPPPPLSCVGTHRREGLATGGKRRRRRKVGRGEVHSLASFGVGRREGGREGT